jgi:hypothetical protein
MEPQRSQLQRRRFLQALALVVVWLLCLNALVGWLGRDAVPRVLVRRIAASHDVTHVFLGNSVVEAGFDPAEFAAGGGNLSTPFHACNAGLGWSTPAEHVVIWDQTLKAGLKPNTVFYGFFDLKLHEPPESAWWSLSGNSAMSYFVNPTLSARYYAPHSFLGKAFMEAAHYVPLFTERVTIWAKVEKLRRSMSEVGMRRGESEPGSAPAPDVFHALEADSAESFARDCRSTTTTNAPFHPAIDDLIASAKQHGCRIVFVEMPMPPQHRQTFYSRPEWTTYKEHLRERLTAAGAELLEAEDWIPDPAAFGDAVHMLPRGAKEFSRQLAAVSMAPHMGTAGAKAN